MCSTGRLRLCVSASASEPSLRPSLQMYAVYLLMCTSASMCVYVCTYDFCHCTLCIYLNSRTNAFPPYLSRSILRTLSLAPHRVCSRLFCFICFCHIVCVYDICSLTNELRLASIKRTNNPINQNQSSIVAISSHRSNLPLCASLCA